MVRANSFDADWPGDGLEGDRSCKAADSRRRRASLGVFERFHEAGRGVSGGDIKGGVQELKQVKRAKGR